MKFDAAFIESRMSVHQKKQERAAAELTEEIVAEVLAAAFAAREDVHDGSCRFNPIPHVH